MKMQDRLSKFSAWFLEKCSFFTAYLHLIAIFTEIGSHIIMILVFTAGLQCNINLDAFHKQFISLEKLMHAVTLGVHGFAPFLVPYAGVREDHADTLTEKLCCYGIIHLPLLDTLIIVVNLMWYKFVLSFYYALYRKDIRRIKLFQILASIKMLMELVYKAIGHNNSNDIYDIDVSWNSDLMNFCVYLFLVTCIFYYVKFLRNKTSKSATTIIKIQSEIKAKIEEKPEQPVVEEKEEKPPAYALV